MFMGVLAYFIKAADMRKDETLRLRGDLDGMKTKEVAYAETRA